MISNDKKQIAIILSVVHWQVARKTEEHVQPSVPLSPPFFPLSEAFFLRPL